MTTLAVRRGSVPLPVVVTLAAAEWLAAWFVNLPAANWVAYEVLGLRPGSHLGDAVPFFRSPPRPSFPGF